MKDAWFSRGAYDYFMGRWSSIVARSFVEWLDPDPRSRWLDLGCGTGVLSEVILDEYSPLELTAIDRSEAFVRAAQDRFSTDVNCILGDAVDIPMADNAVEYCVSGLVLNFLPEPEKMILEMQRVTAKGGSVAIYIWDYAGKMDFLNKFWDTAVELDPKATLLHEGKRFPDSKGNIMKTVFEHAGLKQVAATSIDIETNFLDLNDYWQPFLGGQGPAPTYVQSLGKENREVLRNALAQQLPIQPDGSIHMIARAWAVKGLVG